MSEWSNCLSRNCKGLQSKTFNIVHFEDVNHEDWPLKELLARDCFLSIGKKKTVKEPIRFTDFQ